MNPKYIHTEKIHNFSAAEVIVPFIVELIKPTSVIDIGCGIGTWLKVFQENGIKHIKGIDGDYIDEHLLKINPKYFKPYNLEEPYVDDEKFDMAISLEVAEHLKFSSSKIVIDTITSLSDVVLFSAATINQGGQNHINEQTPQFWINLFEEKGFKMHDILRPIFWENKAVDWWYSQNILIFTKDTILSEKLENFDSFQGKNLIHPITDSIKTSELEIYRNKLLVFNSGEAGIKIYYRLLLKSIKKKLLKYLNSMFFTFYIILVQ